jgi:hypothetical protein
VLYSVVVWCVVLCGVCVLMCVQKCRVNVVVGKAFAKFLFKDHRE